MGSNQGCAALPADQRKEFSEHLVRSCLVKVARRFVGKHQRRPVRQGAGDGDALLLAARKLGRPMIQALRQAKLAEQFLGSGTGSAPWISWGSNTFSSASKSGSRWWN